MERFIYDMVNSLISEILRSYQCFFIQLQSKEGQKQESNDKESVKESTEKNIQKKNGFRETHAKIIGWKSALTKRDTYGIPETRARGKCDILRTFNWPQEGQ